MAKPDVEHRTVNLKAIRTTFFVRAGLATLDMQRVAYLRSLIEAGIQLPDVEVTPDLLLLCGRHRLAAYAELDYEQVRVTIIERESPAEYIAYAFKDNATASLPPTRADVRMVLQQLTSAGVPDTELITLFVPPYSQKYIKQQLEWNHKNALYIKLRAAHNARNEEDLSFVEAATRYHVPVDDLKVFTQRRKHDREYVLTTLRKQMHHMNASYGQQLKEFLKDVEAGYANSTLTAKEVFALLREPQNYGHQIARRALDAEQRFGAEVGIDQAIAKGPATGTDTKGDVRHDRP